MTVSSVSSVFYSDALNNGLAPDCAVQCFGKPPRDFVLCRDENNNATAIYGELIWDFNPYRLSASKITRISFQRVYHDYGMEHQELVEEAKYILYCLIYFAGGGRAGRLSASTLVQYWLVLRQAMQFCYEQREKTIVGVLSLRQIFSVPVYLKAFVNDKSFDQSCLSGILRGLARVGVDRLGYVVVNAQKFDLKRVENNQHPVIPTRIYLELINVTGDLLEQMLLGIGRLESFIACFADDYYGLGYGYQKSAGLGGKAYYRPDFIQAVSDHGLSTLFVGEFACHHKRSLQRVLLNMQYVSRMIIHLYTGMRDQEVMRMSYDCLSEQIVSNKYFDDRGVERGKVETLNLLSTTTKYIGYKKDAAWLAPEYVIKAVQIAQAISSGLAKLYGIPVDGRCPLFLNPSVLCFTKNRTEVGVTCFKDQSTRGNPLRSIAIRAEDMQELAHSDPKRDFSNDSDFVIGKPWPLTSHQFRRSLAFYGSSSGFLSLPTLRTQFKHTTIAMTRYYANNFQNIKTIFGYYDEKSNEFVLPNNHFAFEYQMAVPMAIANQLIADLISDDEPLHGGTGSYMEKQKERLKAGEIHIEDLRSDTLRRVNGGAISYRSTLLGGCTKVGRCDSFMLGDYTECLSCDGAIIKQEKLDSAIADTSDELSLYDVSSGEYQVVRREFERLSSYRQRVTSKKGHLL